MLSLCSLVLGL